MALLVARRKLKRTRAATIAPIRPACQCADEERKRLRRTDWRHARLYVVGVAQRL